VCYIETKKSTEAKKTSNVPPKKVPEKNKVKSSTKKNTETSQRSDQTEVASTSQPSASAQRTVTDKLEVQSQTKTTTSFILEGELSKLKIHIPLSELMRKNAYRS
jgi:hypothetical protein